MYSIGLDIGTTSVCGILINLVSGRVELSRTLPNDSFIKTENPAEKLQNPIRLMEILSSVLDELLSQNKPIASIGITGQMHGIVYLNKTGQPISELKIWQDGRGDLPYKDGLTYAEFMSQKTGYPLATGYGAVTYFYDMINGLVPSDAACFCTIHDLAAMTLCGKTAPKLHPSDAASLGLFDIKNKCYDKGAIALLGLNFDLFPAVCSDYSLMGHFKGIPVSVAIGDNQASFLGAVKNPEESLLINVGTGSQISCLAGGIPKDTNLDCRPLINDSYILAGSSLCGGRSYSILEQFLRSVVKDIAGVEIKSAYPAMDRLTENYTPENEPLNITTLFSGTRLNPQKRGSIENISVNNLTTAALCHGFMQGMVNELYEMFKALKPFALGTPKYIVGSGNGIRNNKALCKKFEAAFNIKMQIPAHKEEAAFGAALYSLVAKGRFATINEAAKLIKYE